MDSWVHGQTGGCRFQSSPPQTNVRFIFQWTATGACGCRGQRAVSRAEEACDHAIAAATTPDHSLVARSAWAPTPSATTATTTPVLVGDDGDGLLTVLPTG